MNTNFRLKAEIKLNKKPPEEAKNTIKNIIDEANQELLRKGAPEGCGAQVTNWSLEDDAIQMEIVSDRYVRAHDALLRLRKPLASAIGGEYHLGIRRTYIIEFTASIESDESFSGLKLPFVKHLSYENGAVQLVFDVDEKDIENRVPDRILNLMEEKIAASEYGGKGEHWELLWESPEKTPIFREDPSQVLLQENWIRRGTSRGQWIYGPQITRLFRAFEEIVIEEIIKPLGYREMIFPKLVTWDVWKRSGHTKGIYPEMYYVCTPKTRDPEFWEDVIDYYKITNEVPLDLIREKIDDPIGGMCYAQCPPFWVFLQGETLPDEDMTIKVFDRSGTSHRYESGGIHGMERVDEFHRIEIVWIGTSEQVIEHSKELQERYKHIFNDVLDLQWRCAWVTPWFMAQEGMAGLAEEKEVGTIDYEAHLPYNDSWLEFQNLSVNGDKYPKGFNVKLQSGDELWSGCSGIGLERWASAFLAQKGIDPEKWPERMREVVGELPRGFRFL